MLNITQKPQRLLPTNLYVVLYNFKSRHQDELDLKAGYKVSEASFIGDSIVLILSPHKIYQGDGH
jgi:hypothetical protein